jgi:hypothetical protein
MGTIKLNQITDLPELGTSPPCIPCKFYKVGTFKLILWLIFPEWVLIFFTGQPNASKWVL